MWLQISEHAPVSKQQHHGASMALTAAWARYIARASLALNTLAIFDAPGIIFTAHLLPLFFLLHHIAHRACAASRDRTANAHMPYAQTSSRNAL